MEKIAVLGASRGLGRAFVAHLREDLGDDVEFFLSSRKLDLLQQLARPRDTVLSCDFSRAESRGQLLEALETFAPQRIFYMAGGGPYGRFSQKNWKDHEWAWEVTFKGAAQVAHWFLAESRAIQMVIIGSAIAEENGDPWGPSYGAAKAALKALHLGVTANPEFNRDLRLFSPGYMDTDLLPPQAHPRQFDQSIMSPNQVARCLWSWVQQPEGRRGHRVLESLD